MRPTCLTTRLRTFRACSRLRARSGRDARSAHRETDDALCVVRFLSSVVRCRLRVVVVVAFAENDNPAFLPATRENPVPSRDIVYVLESFRKSFRIVASDNLICAQ